MKEIFTRIYSRIKIKKSSAKASSSILLGSCDYLGRWRIFYFYTEILWSRVEHVRACGIWLRHLSSWLVSISQILWPAEHGTEFINLSHRISFFASWSWAWVLGFRSNWSWTACLVLQIINQSLNRAVIKSSRRLIVWFQRTLNYFWLLDLLLEI